MNKKRVFALIAAVCAAALMIAVYLILSSADGKSEPEERTLFSAESISEISLEYMGGEMRFIKRGGAWEYAEDPSFPLNAAYLRDMEDALKSVSSKGEIDSDALAQYGLDHPSGAVRAVAGDGSVFECKIGSRNDTSNIVYVLYGGKIHMLAQGFSVRFSHTLEETAGREKLADVQPSGVQKAEIRNSGGTLNAERVTDGLPGTEWSVNGRPGDADAMKELAGTIAAVKPLECLCYKPDSTMLERYGINEASAYAKLSFSGGEASVILGAELDGERNAAYFPERNMIVSVESESVVSIFETSEESLLNRALFPLEYGGLISADVEYSGKTSHIDFAEYGGAWDFYYMLSGIRAESFAPAMPADGDEAVITVKTNKESHVIRMRKYSDDFYASDFWGYVMLINKRDVEMLTAAASTEEQV